MILLELFKESKHMVYLLSFFFYVLYTYYGDNMNGDDVIISVNNIEDIKKITENTKYINIDILNVNVDVIDYFLLHGQRFLYSDIIDKKNGFLYCNYDTFKNGEQIIDNIIDNMPSNLNKLEMIRYLYISLGRLVCADINVINEKNNSISFDSVGIVNNLWSALVEKRVADISASKLFMYICSRCRIKCELISNSIKGSVSNKVYYDNLVLFVDLFNDIYNIQGQFITKYFDKFNIDRNMDKKIFYIEEDYSNSFFERMMKDVDYVDDSVIYKILSLSNAVFDVKRIGTFELSRIYSDIFSKYCPNCDVKINNFFVCKGINSREHFVVINYNNNFYSYNYVKNCFTSIDYEYLDNSLKKNKIGLYDGEEFNLFGKGYIL